jgi:hypothetical protein
MGAVEGMGKIDKEIREGRGIEVCGIDIKQDM